MRRRCRSSADDSFQDETGDLVEWSTAKRAGVGMALKIWPGCFGSSFRLSPAKVAMRCHRCFPICLWGSPTTRRFEAPAEEVFIAALKSRESFVEEGVKKALGGSTRQLDAGVTIGDEMFSSNACRSDDPWTMR